MRARSSFSLLVLSWALVAWGQPVWSGVLAALASVAGFALFWHVALSLESRSLRFWLASGWFAAVQLMQLSWMSATEYMGPLIVVVYVALSLAIGFQFGLVTQLVHRPLTWLRMLMIAGAWTWMEWMRMGLLTGFGWNPVGLSLSGESSIQFASLFGVYGLSFWVFLTNLSALRSRRLCLSLALVPYLFSWIHQIALEPAERPGELLSVALVQTALKVEEKDFMRPRAEAFVSPVVQWKQILEGLASQKRLDTIVFPEAALPWGEARYYYPLELVQATWKSVFGEQAIDFPPLEAPFAKRNSDGQWLVSNSFWAKSLANHFRSDVVIGLDASEGDAKYNSAFLFAPETLNAVRYDKQNLVPIGEYIPLQSIPFIARVCSEQFGISSSFAFGTLPKVFHTRVPMGVSICSEETNGALLRAARRQGAKLFVNLTNDAWFPETHLPDIHFQHARLRAAENGVGVIRACNTGVTGVIDQFGRAVKTLPGSERGVLAHRFTPASHPTLYTQLGDWPLLICSAIFVFFGLRKRLLEYSLVK